MANLDEKLRDEMGQAVDPPPDEAALFEALSRRRAQRENRHRVGSVVLGVVVVAASIGGFLALRHTFREQPASADTTPVVKNGSIIYSSTYGPDGPGDYHLWIAAPDGSNARQLTTGTGVDVRSAVSPDGEMVAFIRLDQTGRFGKWSLWTTTISGEERQLTDPVNQGTSANGLGYPHGLSFSPDGSRIAIDTGVFGPYGIWTVAVDGSDPRLVGATDEISVSGASWSSDGDSIIYAGNPSSAPDGQWDLYVVSADAPSDDIGRQLTDTPAIDELDPTWSPDGNTIAFQQAQDAEGKPGTAIGTVAHDGSGYKILAETKGCCLQEPTWAPDGASLLFVDSNKVESLIQQIAPNGTRRETVVAGADGPAWQPRLGSVTAVSSPPTSAPPVAIEETTLLVSSSGPSSDDALLAGYLIDESGCVAVSERQGPFPPVYVVWPTGYSLSVEDGRTWLTDDNGSHVAAIGDLVKMGGGMTNLASAEPSVQGGIPAGCETGGPDAYWFAGTPEAVTDGSATAALGSQQLVVQEGDGTLYLADVGGSRVALLGAGHDPAWSPDGTQLAFREGPQRESGPPTKISVMNADGTGRRDLNVPASVGGEASGETGAPAWSPDGTAIAFASLRGIFVVDTDGSNLREVAHYTGAHACYDLEPTWSPDGETIAFAIACDGDSEGIWSVPAVGGTPSQLLPVGQEFEDARYPTYSPDGSSIAFSGVRRGSNGFSYGIYVMSADGSNPREAAAPNAAGYPSTWSPDGSRIAYTDGKTGQIAIVALRTQEVQIVGIGLDAPCCMSWRG